MTTIESLQDIADPLAKAKAAKQAELEHRTAAMAAAAVRREAVVELHQREKSWHRVGRLLGVSHVQARRVGLHDRPKKVASRAVG